MPCRNREDVAKHLADKFTRGWIRATARGADLGAGVVVREAELTPQNVRAVAISSPVEVAQAVEHLELMLNSN